MDLYNVIQPAVKYLIRPIWRPTVSGEHNIPASGPVILVSNHQAASETYFLPCLIRREVHWLGKDNLFKGKGLAGRFFAWLMASVNVIPVDRSIPGAGNAALAAGIKVLESGKLLGVFPEGTRSPDGRLYRGKTGAVRLALATGAPIVPVAMLGTFESKIPGWVVPRLSPRIRAVIGAPIDIRREFRALESTSSTPETPSSHDDVGVGPKTDPHAPEPERYQADGSQLRALSRIMMSAIEELSGQEYVDAYAADVKRALKSGNGPEQRRG